MTNMLVIAAAQRQRGKLADGMEIWPNQRAETHLGVWFCDVRAAGAVGGAGARQGGAGHVKHVFGRLVGMVSVLKTHLGAGWNDPSRGGGGRQTSDVYGAGERQEARPAMTSERKAITAGII